MTATTDERLSLPSASSMERFMACAGCRALEKAVEAQAVKPVEKESEAASHGTLLHESNESGDVSDLEMSDAESVKRIRAGEEAITRQWADDNGIPFDEIKIEREVRFWFRDKCSGKVDTMVSWADFLLILDCKSGRRAVTPSVKNWQLRTLAAAVFQSRGGAVTTIRVAIVNLFGRLDPPCDYSAEDCRTIGDMLERRLDLIEQPDQPRTPGPHCTFCPAHAICPELRENLTPILRQRSLNWDLVKPEQKKPLFEMATLGKKACEALLAQLKADLTNDPESCPGLLKKKDGEMRKITDPLGAFDVLLEQTGATPNDFIKAASISLSAYKELLNELGGLNIEQAEKFITDHLAPFITKTPRSGSIEIAKE